MIELIHSLSAADEPIIVPNGSSPLTVTGLLADESDEKSATTHKLGDFNKLWTFLGRPLDFADSDVEPTDRSFTNGGLAHYSLDKGLSEDEIPRQPDESEVTELRNDLGRVTPGAVPSLTKKQRKLVRRQERAVLKQQRETATHAGIPEIKISSEDSESELQKRRSSTDRRAVIQEILYGPKAVGEGTILVPSSVSVTKVAQSGTLKPWSPSKSSQSSNGSRLGPYSFKSAAAKKASLVLRLYERFPDERNTLAFLGSSPEAGKASLSSRTDVHVFVDVSNVRLP